MWAPIAIRRLMAVARTTAIKPIDVSQIYGKFYPSIATNIISVRYKTKSRKKKNKNVDSDDEDSDGEDGETNENPLLMQEPSGDVGKIVELDVNSLRLDVIAKQGFGLSRVRTEECIIKGDIVINGDKAQKKSQDISQGDEIDFVKHINPDDPTMVDIKRLQIMELPDKSDSNGRLKVKVMLQEATVKSFRAE